jgi:hypothetical protein
MKNLLGLLGLVVALLPAATLADASHCYAIKNADMKNNCLATVNHDKSRCYAINDRDLKNSCLAQVGNDKSRCYSIQDRDQKQQCLAEF